MKVIKSILKEELANSLAMKKSYESQLDKLPKGSLVKKKIKGYEYYYLVVREKCPLSQLGLNAQPLRFLDFLAQNTITTKVGATTVTLPHPANFALHKLLVLTRR